MTLESVSMGQPMARRNYILKTQLLILVSAVASNPHRQFDLHRARRNIRCGQFRISTERALLRLCPIFKLRSIEQDDSLVLIFLQQFILLGLSLLVSQDILRRFVCDSPVLDDSSIRRYHIWDILTFVMGIYEAGLCGQRLLERYRDPSRRRVLG